MQLEKEKAEDFSTEKVELHQELQARHLQCQARDNQRNNGPSQGDDVRYRRQFGKCINLDQ